MGAKKVGGSVEPTYTRDPRGIQSCSVEAMASGRVCRSRVLQSSGLHAAGMLTLTPLISTCVDLAVSLSDRRTCRLAYGPPIDSRIARAAALMLAEKKRPDRRMMFIGLGSEGGAPTRPLSAAASVL